MVIIDEILVSDDILETYFRCNINKCKGACCKIGDYGAPLEKEELSIVENILDDVLPYLPKDQTEKILSDGPIHYYADIKEEGTQLMDDGRCVFVTKNELGVYSCGIERAYYDNKIDFIKPISCHLYPIRVSKNEKTGFEALNYDSWEICSDGCSLGKKERILLVEFTKTAIIRKYGEEFYTHLVHFAVENSLS